jgi:hypothetical protein
MNRLALVTFAICAMYAAPASAQQNPDEVGQMPVRDGMRMNNVAVLATTPSRIPSSRREMNRGREQVWSINPTPSQIETFAERALRRGGFQCSIMEAKLVSLFADGTPIVEVACEEDGGLVIADTDPIQFSDCFDLIGATGAIGPCRIPRNVARLGTTSR